MHTHTHFTDFENALTFSKTDYIENAFTLKNPHFSDDMHHVYTYLYTFGFIQLLFSYDTIFLWHLLTL